MQELLDRIKREQDFFPAAQKQVAAYVVENVCHIPFMSITSLAKNIGVSDTTVIKFCNQLGFAGFAEFKKVLSDYVHSQLPMYRKLSNSTLSLTQDGTVFSEVLEEDTSNIESTMNNPINRENLETMLAMMNRADNIYVLGGRSSAILAAYLAATLRYLGLKVHELTGGVCDYWDRLSMVSRKDLVVAFCFPRYTKLTVDAVKALHQDQIRIVLITDTGLSPAYPYADIVFHCSVSSDAYFPCYASCMSLISVIYRSAGAAMKNNASKHMGKLEKNLLQRGIFTD